MQRKRFSFIRQRDSKQCGITCLKMISKFYGRDIDIEYLESICTNSVQGVSLFDLSEASKEIGFNSICSRLSIDQLISLQMPCIIHWNQNHFVVLYKIKRTDKIFYIADPGKGLIKYTKDEFEKHWFSNNKTGIALILKPTSKFYSNKTKNNSAKHTFSAILKYIRQYKRYFRQVFLALIIGCILQIIFPYLTQSIVDVGIFESDVNFIILVLIAQFSLILGKTSIEFIRRWILLHIGMRINISLLSDFFIKLLRLPMKFFDSKMLGDLMQRMNDHQRIQSFLTGSVLDVLFSTLSFLILGLLLLNYNMTIFMIVMIATILYGIWTATFISRRKIIDYMFFEKNAQNNSTTYQFMTTMQEIKLQDCERRRRWEWEDLQAEIFAINMKSLKIQQIQESGRLIINESKNIIVTVIAAISVIEGNMSLGMMIAVQLIVGQINSPISQLINFIYTIQDVKISFDRINEIRTKKDEEYEFGHNKNITTRSIDIKNIIFKYDPNTDKNIINNISIHIPEGKVTAIVGASGSGKTTLLKLILGFYKPLSGDIKLGDQSLYDYNIKWWRNQCGVVMQGGAIFSESIARNIAVSDEEIDFEKLYKSVKIACIDKFIESLPLKFNTIIGRDGINLSQGQIQRILIARAVYKNPYIILLDEATNSLDAENEHLIVENLSKFYKNKTVIIIAHRLSTVKNADQIVVLDNGSVVECGTNNELLEKRGYYYKLVKNQLDI